MKNNNCCQNKFIRKYGNLRIMLMSLKHLVPKNLAIFSTFSEISHINIHVHT